MNNTNNINNTNNSSSNKSEINIKDMITKRKGLVLKQKEKEVSKIKLITTLNTTTHKDEKKIPFSNSKSKFENIIYNTDKAGKVDRVDKVDRTVNSSNNKNNIYTEQSSDELLDIVSEFDFGKFKINKNVNTLNTFNTKAHSQSQSQTQSQNNPNFSNVKITNITNIILGPKSFDIKNMKSNKNDTMLRDVKALHVITQKALSTHSKHNPIDSIDDERRSFFNFQNINSKKALFIDDNSDLPTGIGKENEKEFPNTTRNNKDEKENYSNSFTFSNNEPSNIINKQKQIINIININNNYNIGNINMPQIENTNSNTNINNYYSCGGSQQFNKSFRTMNISNYKKNMTSMTSMDSKLIPPSNSDTPVMESARSNKTGRKLIPRNSNPSVVNQFMMATSSSNKDLIESNNKSIKDIIKSVKKDGRKEKFINLAKKYN